MWSRRKLLLRFPDGVFHGHRQGVMHPPGKTSLYLIRSIFGRVFFRIFLSRAPAFLPSVLEEMQLQPDFFEGEPHRLVDRMALWPQTGVQRRSLPGPMRDNYRSQPPGDFLVYPILGMRGRIFDGTAKSDPGVAVFVEDGGKPEKAAEQRPPSIMFTP
jgi:hypothetical protein